MRSSTLAPCKSRPPSRRRTRKLRASDIVDVVLIGVVCALLIGCATPNTVLTGKPDAVYLYDMTGLVNATEFNGVGVIPYNQSYTMDLTSLVDIDLITISSCHRDYHAEAAFKSPDWLNPRRTFRYVFTPVPGIENTGSCLVRIGAYTKAGGQAAWAILDFKTPDSQLPAVNYCNGDRARSEPVTICQSRVGLAQRLQFGVPVEISETIEPRCKPADVRGDGLTWEFAQAPGECVVYFQEVQPPHRLHRHTTVSYTDILIRGVK